MVFDERVRLYISSAVLEEIMDVAHRPKVMKKLHLESSRVVMFINAIEAAGVFVDDFPDQYSVERDPDDSHYINLALAAQAKLIVSRDRDLLDLMDQSKECGKEFADQYPNLAIITPPALLAIVNADRISDQ